jgi:hypothetical protein
MKPANCINDREFVQLIAKSAKAATTQASLRCGSAWRVNQNPIWDQDAPNLLKNKSRRAELMPQDEKVEGA